jgi:hypothetical protein
MEKPTRLMSAKIRQSGQQVIATPVSLALVPKKQRPQSVKVNYGNRAMLPTMSETVNFSQKDLKKSKKSVQSLHPKKSRYTNAAVLSQTGSDFHGSNRPYPHMHASNPTQSMSHRSGFTRVRSILDANQRFSTMSFDYH